jgi:hypothetical protein
MGAIMAVSVCVARLTGNGVCDVVAAAIWFAQPREVAVVTCIDRSGQRCLRGIPDRLGCVDGGDPLRVRHRRRARREGQVTLRGPPVGKNRCGYPLTIIRPIEDESSIEAEHAGQRTLARVSISVDQPPGYGQLYRGLLIADLQSASSSANSIRPY